ILNRHKAPHRAENDTVLIEAQPPAALLALSGTTVESGSIHTILQHADAFQWQPCLARVVGPQLFRHRENRVRGCVRESAEKASATGKAIQHVYLVAMLAVN